MTDQQTEVIRLNPADNIVVALKDLAPGTALPGVAAPLTGEVKRGHKIAAQAIPAGTPVMRYGQTIGLATEDIPAGAWVHSHNLGMGPHTQDYAFGADSRALPPATDSRTFQGYLRADGKVGTRNYLGILTSVNCSGSVARFIAEAAEKAPWLSEFENLDGIVPIVHQTGCGMSGKDEGYDTLFRTLAGYARNPNFGGILLVGLGCEVMQIPDLIGTGRMRADGNFRYMTIQQTGGTRKTIAKALDVLKEMGEVANRAKRTPQPVSHLTVGLQCGGSDGYSGITANPALGYASDLLVRHGGTTILSETPEIYGAEHLLTRRAVTPEVGQKLIDRIKWWEDYTARNQGEMDNNPSPGNKRGGLTTILEKSLGAVAKGGTAPLSGVYKFAEPITTPGFVYMDSPGYDPASVTGQIASGATMIIFTTGRGSVSGYKPSPCIKLATNTEMYDRMSEDMDLNCGDIITKGVSVAQKGEEIFEMLIRVASGDRIEKRRAWLRRRRIRAMANRRSDVGKARTPMRLQGKTAFLTAAGAGIGQATARAFAAEGARVIATDVNEAALEPLKAEGIEVHPLDVTDPAAIKATAARIGAVDILFNCAGFVHHGTILDCDEAAFDFSMTLNVRSQYLVTRAFLPAMLAAGGGSIVNMASAASSIIAAPNRYVYGATKAAVIGMTKSIAADYIGQGIRCNAVCPATVESPSLQDRMKAQGDYETARAAFVARQPMGRIGQPPEIAALVVFLASDEASFITGQAIAIDGGWTNI